MDRLAAIVVVLLIGGTAAAFAYTEGLKQTKSPVVATHVFPKEFSPTCGCPTRVANVAFGLRRSDHLTLSVVDSHGQVVRIMVDDRAVGSGYHRFTWNGHLVNGRLAPDGVYKPRVELSDADRTIDLPNPIRLDTKPPRIVGASPRVTGTELKVAYRVDEASRGLLYVGGTRVIRTHRHRLRDVLEVSLAFLRNRGLSGRVAVGAEDLAGNVSKLRVLKLTIGGKR